MALPAATVFALLLQWGLISWHPCQALQLYAARRHCAWRICHSVIVENSPEPNRWRSLVLHRCSQGNNFPEKCYLPEVVDDPGSVFNFTMRKADLTMAPLLDFCMFERLAGIDLSENMITEFVQPANITTDCLAQLRWLSLRGNWLRSVDISQFLVLTALEKVDLSENSQLETLYVTHLTPNTRLKAILAAKCRIKMVDISLVRLPSLQDIDLNYNQLSVLTNRLNWDWSLKDVRDIEMERNRRKSLDSYYYARLSILMVQNQLGPEAFGRHRLWGLPVPDLQEAAESRAPDDAVVNQLKRYRDAFQSFLYIDNFGSTITCDCRLFQAWQYLQRVYGNPREFSKRNALSLTEWATMPCDPTAMQPQLRYRTITSLTATDLLCWHSQGCPFGCVCTEFVSPSQMVVDCRGANLPSMPDSLPNSVHPVRYVLLLAGNRISSVRAVPRAELVQEIDLSGNLLGGDTDFTPLAAYSLAHYIDLSNNSLLTDLTPSLINVSLQLPVSVLRLPSEGLLCRCQLFDPDWALGLRRLAGNQRGGDLRCRLELGRGGGGSQVLVPLTDYRHRYCSSTPTRQNISTAVAEVSPAPAPGLSSAALGAVIAVPVGVIGLVVILVAIACYRRRRRGDAASAAAAAAAGHCGKASEMQLQPQLQLQQQQQQQYMQIQQYSPAPGCRLQASPYDTASPRYVSSSGAAMSSEQLYNTDSRTTFRAVAAAASSASSYQGQHRLRQPLITAHRSRDSIGSSDLSSGDLSGDEEEEAAAAAAAAQGNGDGGGGGSEQRRGRRRHRLDVATAAATSLVLPGAEDLPPPLPPRPTAMTPSAVRRVQPQQLLLLGGGGWQQGAAAAAGTFVSDV